MDIRSTLPILNFNVNYHMQELMDERALFKQKFDNCYQAILVLCEIIRKIFQLKVDNIEHLKDKMKNLKLKLEFIDIKQKVMFCKLQDLIFKETSETEKAVDIAIKDLRKSHETLSTEITKMEKEFLMFENMSRTSETGKLVRKYINYKEEISRMELVIKEFK
ncbi:uncharacterized protein LOC123298909 [Chrysoperla carnea]|uniref:uncharacterized protein LOC123298909 n=1 Tax=Chrysoperla carnea TaxID=189513 RepID=UPI001D06E01C|nr:uncharacterized protein LOC123298909 [Chrysoperla carnea]